MNDGVHNKYHATARSKRRAVVGIILATTLLVGLGVQWAKTGSMSDNGSVGSGAELGDGVIGVVSLYDNTIGNSFIDRFKAHALVNREIQTIALMNDGTIAGIEANERESVITSATRPHGWFLPRTVGVFHVKEGASVKAYRVSASSDTARVSAESSTAMNSYFPANAVTGMHLECKRDCVPIEIIGVDLAIPGNIQNFDFVSVIEGGDTKSLLTFSKRVPSDEIERFARQLSGFASPMYIERELESGVTITEIVPNDDIEATSLSSIQATAFGTGDELVYFATTEEFSYIATSRNLIEGALGDLSTTAWTNKICGQRPSTFFPINFSSTFAENPASPLYIVRNRNSWSICEN